jgi:hypothetical protein
MKKMQLIVTTEDQSNNRMLSLNKKQVGTATYIPGTQKQIL